MMVTHFFVAQSYLTSRGPDRSQIFKKEFLPPPTTINQTPSDYAGLIMAAVFKISLKYVGIMCSLPTRRH